MRLPRIPGRFDPLLAVAAMSFALYLLCSRAIRSALATLQAIAEKLTG
jgi:hypothetical protein